MTALDALRRRWSPMDDEIDGRAQFKENTVVPQRQQQAELRNNKGVQMMMTEDEFFSQMARDRDVEIAGLAKEMMEVQSLFVKTAELVEVQGEGVGNIQTAIEASLVDVEKAVDELKEADRYQKEKRKNVAIGVGAGAGIGAIVIAILTLKFLPGR